MGNYKFRLSEMMPNAWFYKLKDMAKSSPKKPHPSSKPIPTLPRKSYYFTPTPTSAATTTADPPRKSSKLKSKRRTPATARSSPKLVSAGCNCGTTLNSVWSKSDLLPEFYDEPEAGENLRSDQNLTTESCSCRLIDIDAMNSDQLDVFDPHLAPIITKPSEVKKKQSITVKEEVKTTNSSRRFSVNSAGLKLRMNSPRIVNKKIQSAGRKSVSRSIGDSFAVMKSSANPRRDFRESMVEMIVENNLRGSKDLEELLACYLSLNSDEYHDVIIKVFKQIWFDFITDNGHN